MVIVFFLCAIALVCIAVAFVVPIILRDTESAERIDRRQKNIEVARQRLAEMERSEALGGADSAEVEAMQVEIERGLLDDLRGQGEIETEELGTGGVRARQWTAVAVALLIPVSAGLLYLAVGEPVAITQSTPTSTQAQNPDGGQSGIEVDGENISFDQMTERLLTFLAENPEDVEGWSTLATVFVAQQKFAEAASAYRKVRELSGDSADLLVREADAMAMANNGELAGEPESLVLKALQLDPQHPSGLWLAGIASAARADYAPALEYWRQAEAVIPNEEFRLEIRRLIAGAEAELANAGGSAMQSDTGTDTEAPSVRVSVSIEPGILEQVNPQDVLYVLARAVEGPPMPLAVVRKQVSDAPFVVELDDSLAMMENLKLSAFEEVSVVARISRTGNPIAASGDYFGEVGACTPCQPA